VPQSQAEWQNFFRQCAWVYNLYYHIVKVLEGRRMLLEERATSNAYRVLKKLINYARTSTHAKLHAQTLLKRIHDTVFNSRSAKLAAEHIDAFAEMVEQYNELQTDPRVRLTDPQILTLLQQSVAETPRLQAVQSNDMIRVTNGLSPMNFGQYMTMLRHEATLIDEVKIRATTSRSTNVHNVDEERDEQTPEETPGVDPDDLEYRVYEAMQRAGNENARINDVTWGTLPRDTRRAWTTIPMADREAILKAGAASGNRKVNVSEVIDTLELAPEESEQSPGTVDAFQASQASGSTTPRTSNPRNSDAYKSAHPADPRRMMSQGNKSKPPARRAEVAERISYNVTTGRRAEVAERISYNVTTEPVDWNGGTEDSFEQPDPLNHNDTMGRFMEQCCQPDMAKDHETIPQPTTSARTAREEEDAYNGWLPYSAMVKDLDQYPPTTSEREEEEDYYEGYTPDEEYYADKAYLARRDARREAMKGDTSGPADQYEECTQAQARAEYTEKTTWSNDEDGPCYGNEDGDGACYDGDAACYDSYSSDEDNDGSEKDYDSDFV
jgi:hypothetical protein